MLAAAMQVTISASAMDTVATDAGLINTLAVDSSGDTLSADSGLPYDVPCQLISFDLTFQLGGQL
jgi:hypothetical protein